MYLATTFEAVSSILIWEKNKVQKPIYYKSQVLHGAEIRYSWIEKIIFMIIMIIWWLYPYFQANSIKILTDLPLSTLLQLSDTSERMAKWMVELSEFDLSYIPRSSMKAQILADFIIEYTPIDDGQVEDQPHEETSEPA